VDGEPVGEPSECADLLAKLCPQYMSMGMTYDEFWNSNTTVHRAYREAYELRVRQEEWGRWRQGAYVFTALLCAAPIFRSFTKGEPKPGKYPTEPWPITEKEAQEREEKERNERFERFLAKLNQESETSAKGGE